MMKKLYLLWFVLAAFSANVLASNSLLDEIIERGVIRVGTTGDYVPFSYTKKSQPGQFVGIDVELAKDLAQTLGVELKFVQTSWPSFMDDMLSKKFDIGMSGMTITLERQKQVLFSIPARSGGKAAITRDENVQRYKTMADINKPGVRVIVNPGGTNERFTRANFSKATIILNKDNITVFDRIVKGEADLMVTDAIETLVQQKIHPELQSVNPDKPFNTFEKAYVMNRDHTFKAFVDQWLNLRKKDGTYQQVVDKTFKDIEKNYADIH